MMGSGIPFLHTYSELPDRFYAQVDPEKVSSPELIAWNQALAEDLGITLEGVDEREKAEMFSGNIIPETAKPIALAYAGHQFGHPVPQLGDGRALLLGELRDRQGQLFDVQLKGSGRTPFSRRGDGKSPLGPVIREYLVSEAMHHLGVPTTRALAAVSTGETVRREENLKGGVFTRVADSHIRVGTFEYFAMRQDQEALKLLLNYAINRHYPEINKEQNKPLSFIRTIMHRKASLVAKWMGLGFIHGVMNTDNTSIAGVTIDFGPCAFMDEFNEMQVFSYIDQHGRYAYKNQPPIAHWNITRLAETLIPLFEGSPEEAIKTLEEELAKFKDIFDGYYLQEMYKKFGIEEPRENDKTIIASFLNYLQQNQIDFTLGFRNLSGLLLDREDAVAFFKNTEEFKHFLKSWQDRLTGNSKSLSETARGLLDINPLYIPRNHLVEKAIADAYRGDYQTFYDMNEVLSQSFQEQNGKEVFAQPPKSEERVCQTFCGT